jgi:hypothetical protein
VQGDDRDGDDDVWRSIVENYGDRVELDTDPEPPPAPAPVWVEPVAEVRAARDEPVEVDPDRFVPPDPPLPPRPTRDRLAAWIGVLGSPLVLLVLVLTSTGVPSLLAYALVLGFVGGFLYLVLHLPRSPEDPWDDGARL